MKAEFYRRSGSKRDHLEVNFVAYAKVNGVKLYYELQGEGEPLAFLNGIFMSTKSWSPQTKLFSKKYKVLLHDFRGQWQSDTPSGKYSFELHADDFQELLLHLGVNKIHVVGTSYGGEVAMAFAIKYPEMVKSLTLITSVSEIHLELKLLVERWLNAANVKDPRIFITEWLADVYSEEFLKDNWDFLWPRLNEAFEVFDFNGVIRLSECFLNLKKKPLTSMLNKITAPTLIIAAGSDKIKPLMYSEIIHDQISGSELHLIDKSGHGVVIEKANELNTIVLGFLEKLNLK